MPPCEALREALALSESMCRAGQEGQWERFSEASRRRDGLLRGALPLEPGHEPQLRRLLEALSRCDRKLLALAEGQRLHCETQIFDHSRSRKASNAYAGVRRLNRLHPSKV